MALEIIGKRINKKPIVALCLFVISFAIVGVAVAMESDESDAAEYGVYVYISNGSYVAPSSIYVGPTGTSSTEITVTASSGYVLPSSEDIIIYVNGSAHTNFTYDGYLGDDSATISISGINGSVSVSISCIKSYNVSINISYGDQWKTISAQRYQNKTFSYTLPKITGFDYPHTISSSDYTQYSYDESTGKIGISSTYAYNSISFNATYVAKTYNVDCDIFYDGISSGIPDKSSDGIGAKYGEPYWFTIPIPAGYEGPDDIKVYVDMVETKFTESNYSGKTTIRIEKVTGDVLIKASCSAINYTIKYFDNSEELEVYPKSHTYGQITKLPTEVEKEKYIFKGWFLDNKHSGSAITELPKDHLGNIIFYAYFEEDKNQMDTSEVFTIYYAVIGVCIAVLAGMLYYTRR